MANVTSVAACSLYTATNMPDMIRVSCSAMDNEYLCSLTDPSLASTSCLFLGLILAMSCSLMILYNAKETRRHCAILMGGRLSTAASTLRRLRTQERRRAQPSQGRIASCLDTEAASKPYLSVACQRAFLAECWGVPASSVAADRTLQQFAICLAHYEKSCQYVARSLQRCTHSHFCKVVQILASSGSSCDRQTCEKDVGTAIGVLSSDPESIAECIEFVGEAILMLDLSEWKADETLASFLCRTFDATSQQEDQFLLPVSFNAATMDRKAGIRVFWIQNINSHLHMASDLSAISIFYHVKILHLYRQNQHWKAMFPAKFLEETSDTIALMLPSTDWTCKKWFLDAATRDHLDLQAGQCRYLGANERRVQNFTFWRDRLIIAKETFDSATPNSLLQFWRDDRNKVQWWTFWIAFLVFWLTMVGVIASVLQVYKAFYPTQ